MFLYKAIKDILAEFVGARLVAGLNKNNPVCPGCNKRDNPEYICYHIVYHDILFIVCGECADQNTYNKTGCRYGWQYCGHHSCFGPKEPLLFEIDEDDFK